MSIEISEFFQIDSYCLESPVSCSVHHVGMANPILTNQLQSLNSSKTKHQTLTLTLWDQKHNIENYLIESFDEKHQGSEHYQTKISKIGDLKNHKFALKKAYTFGSYLIILDENSTVTVRHRWSVIQTFTDVEDIVLYDQRQKNLEKSHKFSQNNQLSEQSQDQLLSSIFILVRIQKSEGISKKDMSKNSSIQSQFIAILIQQNSSNLTDSYTKESLVQNLLIHKSKIKTKLLLTLASTGKWAFFEDFVVCVSVQKPKIHIKKSLNEENLNIKLRVINLDFLQNKSQKSVMKFLEINETDPNTFEIFYISCSQQIIKCSFIQFQNNTNTQIIDFLQGQKLPHIIERKQNFNKIFTLANDFSSNRSKNMIFLVWDNFIQIYSTISLEILTKISLLDLIVQPLSQDYSIVYYQTHKLWIFDRANSCLHKLHFDRIIEEFLLKPFSDLLNPKSQQISKSHHNTIKILNMRLKILNLLKYYLQDNKQFGSNDEQIKDQKQKQIPNPIDYASCFRLLCKQENISILNDSISYLIRFILGKNQNVNILEASLQNNFTIKEIQELLVKLLYKLILSKYQSHVQNGLELLLRVFSFFTFRLQSQQATHKALYKKIMSSHRVQKLLQQQKKQKIWQLAYTLSLKCQILQK